MHIDFAPPSGGTYNNAGSSRQLVSYMEHEDLERMEKGIYTDGFFNLMDDNIYKSKVIKDIDGNIGQLLKTDAKTNKKNISPSESAEIQAFSLKADEEKLKTEYQSFKPSSMSVFYGDSESDSEPSSLIDNLYPQNNS